MCPFCILTTVAIVSGSISAGGLGVFLIGKAWTHGNTMQASACAEASHLSTSKESSTPSGRQSLDPA